MVLVFIYIYLYVICNTQSQLYSFKINQHIEKHLKFVYIRVNKDVQISVLSVIVKWDSPVQVVHYVGVFVFPHHQDLVDDQLFLGLLLQVHLLDGNLKKETRNL